MAEALEDDFFSMRSCFQLDPMISRMKGKLSKEFDDFAPGIIDDSVETAQVGPSSGPVSVIRVLHVAPTRQKTMPLVLTRMRSDHVAVSSYVVTDKCSESGTVHIQGQHLDGCLDAVGVLAMYDFIAYGAGNLRK